MNGLKQDIFPSSKVDYAVLVLDGLRNIGVYQRLALDKKSIQAQEDLLNSIDATSAEIRSHINKWKSIT